MFSGFGKAGKSSIKNIHRIAGVSLASAVGLGAAGQHRVRHEVGEDDYRWNAYTTANRYFKLLEHFTVIAA